MPQTPQRILIVGAGQAAAQAAQSLRQGGFAGAIVMLGEEPVPPYQRPPLSKAYLSGAMGVERVVLKPRETWAEERVELHTGVRATAIDRAARVVRDAEGRAWPYDALILATGSRVRKMDCPGADLGGLHHLRTMADVDALRADLLPGRRLVVVGGGYIGLEVAAVARKAGLDVTVVEAAARVLARVTTPEISTFFDRLHADAGVTILTGAGVDGFVGDGPEGEGGRVVGVRLHGGRVLPADVVLIGIGILPNADLAVQAGLPAGNGIETDRDARTADPAIFAIGDCASRPLVHYGDRRGRLESVHNALEQAKLAAAAILGAPRPVEETPWFWSDQYDVKLQIAGLSQDAVRTVVRGDPDAKRFAAFHLGPDDVILGVDAVNSPPEFLVGRQLIARRARLAPARLADMSVSMKEIAAGV